MSYFKDDDLVFKNNDFDDITDITAKTIREIDSKMNELNLEYKNNFSRAIEDAIEMSIPYRIPSNMLDEIKTNFLGPLLKRYQDKLDTSLKETITDTGKFLINAINQKKDINNMFLRYCDYLKAEIKHVNTGRYEDDVAEFSRSTTNQIRKYLVGYKGFTDDARLDAKLSELRMQLSSKVRRTFERYLEDYSSRIRDILTYNVNSVKMVISHKKNEEDTNKKFETFKNIVCFGNFELVSENGIYYLVNKSSLQKYTATIDEMGTLTTVEDNSIKFALPDESHKQIGYQDNKVIVRLVKNNIFIVDKSNNRIQISSVNGTYSVIYNDEEVKGDKIGDVISHLQSIAPGCYSFLSGIPFFMRLINQRKKNEESSNAAMFVEASNVDSTGYESDWEAQKLANRKAFR